MTPSADQALTGKPSADTASAGRASAGKALTRTTLLLPTLCLPTILLPTLFLPTPLAEAAYDAKGQRDPFVALLTPEGAVREPAAPRPAASRFGAGDLALEGIVYDPRGDSIAILDGEVFRAGDIRGGIEVLTVGPSSVIILKDGLERELELPSATEEGGP